MAKANEEKRRMAWNFKRLREQRGWSQEEAAGKINSLTNYIAQIEGQQCSFGINARKKWAGIFEVDISEFYKPIVETEKDRLIESIRFQLMSLDTEKLIRIKDLIPIAFGGVHAKEREFDTVSDINEKKSA